MLLHEQNDIVETSDVVLGVDELGRDTVNEYTLIKELGQGAQAKVCLGTKIGEDGKIEKYVLMNIFTFVGTKNI